MRSVLTWLILIVLVVSPSTASAISTDSLTIRADRPIVTRSAPPLGVNLNYLVDGEDQRPVGSIPLAEALSGMRVAALRYPGGEKSDTNLWSTPPYDAPRPTLARTGPNQWPGGSSQFVSPDGSWVHAPMDFDQFLALTQQTGAVPMVVVPFDSAFAPAEPGGTAPTYDQLKETAVAWVRYAAGRVKYWEIGNESYRGSWNGTPTREQYIAGLIDFSRAMKQADPTIQIGANGRDMAWWQAVIQQAGDAIDFLSVHDYPVWNWSGYDSYRTYSGSLASLAKIAGGAIETYGTPAQKTRLWVAVTELNVLDYGSPGWQDINDLGHALALAQSLGEHLTLPRVRFVLIWNTRWVTSATEPHRVSDVLTNQNTRQPIGEALRLMSTAALPTAIQTTSSSTIKSYASIDTATGRLVIALINRGTVARHARLTLNGFRPNPSSLAGETLSGSGPGDLAPVVGGLPPSRWSNRKLIVTLPPTSLTVMQLTR